MENPAGGSSVVRPADLTEQDESLVRHLVTETMRRVPSSVVGEELMASGRAAAIEARRTHDADHDGDFMHVATTRIRAALVETLRSIDWSARGLRSPAPVSSDRVGAVRAAVAALPGDRRAVIESYFLLARSLPDIGVDLALDPSDVVALRNDALRALRRTLAPVLAAVDVFDGAAQAVASSSGSSGTGSPRTWNLR